MYTLENVLNNYSKKKLKTNYNLMCYIKISTHWQKIMGETLSKICFPEYFFSNTLTISVPDSVWANEIMMKQVIIFKNIKKYTSISADTLKTKVGYVKKQENIKQEKEIFITDKDLKWIDKTVKEINMEDEKLKDLFISALKTYVKEESK